MGLVYASLLFFLITYSFTNSSSSSRTILSCISVRDILNGVSLYAVLNRVSLVSPMADDIICLSSYIFSFRNNSSRKSNINKYPLVPVLYFITWKLSTYLALSVSKLLRPFLLEILGKPQYFAWLFAALGVCIFKYLPELVSLWYQQWVIVSASHSLHAEFSNKVTRLSHTKTQINYQSLITLFSSSYNPIESLLLS